MIDSADPISYADELRTALENVLKSDGFRSSSSISAFLVYVVERTIANDADSIKGYTIAVDALGRPETFDPQKDPFVRVLATRVRSALDLYYAAEGKEDAFRIQLPKGKYIPKLVPNEIPTSRNAENGTDTPPSLMRCLAWHTRSIRSEYGPILLIGLLLAAASSVYLSYQRQDSVRVGASDVTVDGLFVEVSSFSNENSDTLTSRQAEGVRQQLISDISKFKDVVVSDFGELAEGDGPTADHRDAEFRISGSLLSFGKLLGLTIAVSDADSKQLLWSEYAQVPNTAAEYRDLTTTMVRNVVTKLAGPSGLFQTEMEKRLSLGSIGQNPEFASSYECLVRFRAFDRSKRRELRGPAQSCLENLIRQGTMSSSVWAAYAMMKLFTWASTRPVDEDLLEVAMSSAEKSIQLDPLNSFGHEVKGTIELGKGEWERAEEAYRHAIQLNPLKPRTHVLLAWTRAIKGDWDEGIDEIRRVVERAPSPPGWFKIPLAIDAYKKGAYAESLSLAEEILGMGDRRGAILAVPAAMQLEKFAEARKYRSIIHAGGATDPLQELRSFFNDPGSMESYAAMFVKASMLDL